MRVYTVEMVEVAITTAITLVQVKCGTNSILRLLRAWCTQSNITTSAMQSIKIVRKTAAATVTSFTPLQIDKGDAASNMISGVAATGTNASAEGADGDVIVATDFNLLNGFLWIPTPEERIIIGPGNPLIALKLGGAPGASTTMSAGFLLGEEGS